MTTVVPNQSDLNLGATLHKESLYVGTVEDVDLNKVYLQLDGIDAMSSSSYLIIKSGDDNGKWFEILNQDLDGSGDFVEFDVDMESLDLSVGSQVEIRRFWTLESLFPDGSFPVSQNVGSPSAQVLFRPASSSGLNVASSLAYFYHDGSSGFLDEGWYRSGTLAVSNDVAISPEESITIRNGLSEAIEISVSGSVKIKPSSMNIVSLDLSDNDNYVYNPFPVDVNINDLNLIESGVFEQSPNVGSPVDRLLVYSQSPSGINEAPSQVLFYHDGSSGFLDEGWYQAGTLVSADSTTISAGGGLIIRKSSGEDEIMSWNLKPIDELTTN